MPHSYTKLWGSPCIFINHITQFAPFNLSFLPCTLAAWLKQKYCIHLWDALYCLNICICCILNQIMHISHLKHFSFFMVETLNTILVGFEGMVHHHCLFCRQHTRQSCSPNWAFVPQSHLSTPHSPFSLSLCIPPIHSALLWDQLLENIPHYGSKLYSMLLCVCQNKSE